MKLTGSMLIAAATLFAVSAHAELLEKSMKAGGVTVQYKVVLPNGYDKAKSYPAILTFGGGPQTMNTVDQVLKRNLQPEAEKRGYIVIAVAAPEGELFFEGGDRIFPEFLDKILAEYKIDGNKFHIAGPSNGGIAAMHVAAKFPRYFISATAFPGYVWQPSKAKLDAISNSHICVFLYVGENDEYRWHDEMESEVMYLRTKGTKAYYTVEAGQPHRMATLQDAGAARLFDDFEESRKGCATTSLIPR